MDVTTLDIPDVKVLRPRKHGDARGFFSEVFKRSALRDAGIDAEWVQDNHSMSPTQGTLRGLHFQAPPFAQAKLVRVTRGRILDVAVDLRKGSPTFGRHVAAELSDENWLQIFIPVGFAHGFCTMTPDVEVQYKVSAEYSQPHDLGVAWNDPDLKIQWPVAPGEVLLSAKDSALPQLRELPDIFR